MYNFLIKTKGSQLSSCWTFLIVLLMSSLSVNGQLIERFMTLSDRLTVSWTVDMAKETVTFELTAVTKGFIGFGLSPQGGMDYADVIIGGVDDAGREYFTDRFARGKEEPKIDTSQDWYLLTANENATHTILRFYRAFDTCDDAEDLPINDDTTKFIWSLGATDDIVQHAERGASSVNILDPYIPPVDTTLFDTWEVKVNTTIPTQDTTYWCTAHKTPASYKNKRHVVGFKVKIESPEARKHNHHLVLHKCSVLPGTPDADILEQHISTGKGGACYEDDGTGMDSIQQLCQTYLYVWATGGDPLFLPENVGFPINREGLVEYFLLEIHYDNPQVLPGIQYDTGLDVYTTENLRPVDAGMLVIGHNVQWNQVIPPSSQNYVINGHCSSRCTQERLNETGINIVNVLLHAHLSGRQLKLRHFRPDETTEGKFKELPWVAYDNHYDFNYQQNRPLRNPRKILPGDHLTYECTYDSTWREPPSTTLGGMSTRHEMCETFLMYYPAMDDLRRCFSETQSELVYQSFNIVEVDFTSDMRDPTILKPDEMAGKNFSTILDTLVDWTPQLRSKLQDIALYSEHYDGCVGSQEETPGKLSGLGENLREYDEPFLVTYPKDIEPYKPEEKDCSNGVQNLVILSPLNVLLIIVMGVSVSIGW